MITPQDIADVLNAAGVETKRKLEKLVEGIVQNNELAEIDTKLHALIAEQNEALAPTLAKRTALTNRRAEIQLAIKNKEV